MTSKKWELIWKRYIWLTVLKYDMLSLEPDVDVHKLKGVDSNMDLKKKKNR